MNDDKRLCDAVREAWPSDPPDPVEWGEDHVQFPGSARSLRFNASITPWIKEPIYRAAQGLWLPPRDHYLDTSTEARIVTLMKPVQSGGSAFGELMLLYWIRFARGIIQYNWTDDDKAHDRWHSRVEAVLKACDEVKNMIDNLSEDEAKICEIDFGSAFFKMQGAFNPGNLDSDSVPMQINEEVHAWKPGHLDKAGNRSTAVWNYKRLDISNAGAAGDQLDMAFRAGTMQRWEVECPGCSNKHHKANRVFHQMRTKWEDRRPDLGGLRYDADGARLGPMDYDYNKIQSTVRFQMPCGFPVNNFDVSMRRFMSLSGRYSDPENKGADMTHRSYTYEAVSVDFIDWVMLVKQKHAALRARKLGDPGPWRIYRCERECIPYDSEDIPLRGGVVVLSGGVKKSREGLPPPRLRTFSLDRQQGNRSAGEFPYWWLLIRDYKIFYGVMRSMLVYEGRLETDEQAVRVLDDHECERWRGCADSGFDADYVYAFCMRYGINAVKGGKDQWYTHDGGARRIYSPERPLHSMVNCPSKYPYVEGPGGVLVPDDREPMFWLYSKGGIRERLHYLRNNTQHDVPEDVSEDYKAHQEAEERTVRRNKNGQEVVEWTQVKRRNDQFVNECYSAMLLDMSGAIGEAMDTANTEDRSK